MIHIYFDYKNTANIRIWCKNTVIILLINEKSWVKIKRAASKLMQPSLCALSS